MKAYKEIEMISGGTPIASEEFPLSHALNEREMMKRPTGSMLLAITLTVVIMVSGLLCPTPAHAAGDTLDQAQTATWTDVWRIGGGYRPEMAQIVTAGMYGFLHQVSLYLDNLSATGPVTVSIQTVIGGVPSGKQIGYGEIPADVLPLYGQPGWVDVTIMGNVLVAPGTQYAVVLSSGDGTIRWYSSGNVYSRGYMLVNEGSGWSSWSVADAMFKTYVIPDTLDQSQGAWNGGFSQYSSEQTGQIFTAGLSGVLDRVSVYLINYNYHAIGPVEASIQTVTGGLPSGTVIGHGSIPDGSIPYWPGGWVTIDISGATVIRNTQYALVLHGVGEGDFMWYLWYYCDNCGMVYNGGQGWTANLPYGFSKGDAAFQTYVAMPILRSLPPPPRTITPCVNGVCPAAKGGLTPADPTDGVESHFRFWERPNGTVQGILSFNDSGTGDLVLQGCVTDTNNWADSTVLALGRVLQGSVTDSAGCRLTVTTFACTDQHAMTVAGTYTPKGGTATSYKLILSGVKDGIGTFTLSIGGDYVYTVMLDGIVDVTCP
jgi:hypothetical protein